MKSALNSEVIGDPDALDWLIVWRASRKSENTIAYYSLIVRQLIGFFDKPLRDVTRADVIEWLDDAEQRWQRGGIVSRLKAIKCLYNWLIEEGVITKSPWRSINVKPNDDPQPTCSEEQLKAMLDGATRQEAAVIWTLAETGMRKNECANLELGDVNIQDGTIRIRVSKSRARVMPMSDELVIAMQKWLRERGSAQGSLWKPSRGTNDAYSMIRHTLSRRSAGTVTPHMLRRRFCINWLLTGHSEASLVRLMGWKDATMVAVYTAAAADQIVFAEFRRFKDATAA